jgi:hypothetical protein
MQSKKPKHPVINDPQQKTVASQVPLCIMLFSRKGSPLRITAGRRKTAEPMFVHHANSMVELLQCGSELLMSTACSAMKREDSTP